MNRRELVLAALAADGPSAEYEPVQVQKLFFLIDKEIPELVGGEHFNFRAYDYGPFDSAVYSEIESMAKVGLAAIAPGYYRSYSLTPAGYEQGVLVLDGLAAQARDFLSRSAKWVRSLSFNQLVGAIYKAYPEMRENSVFQEPK